MSTMDEYAAKFADECAELRTENETVLGALDRAHSLLANILMEPKRQDGSIALTPELIKDCEDWIAKSYRELFA